MTPPSSPWGARQGTFGTLYLALWTIARRSQGSMLSDRTETRGASAWAVVPMAFLLGSMLAFPLALLPAAQGAFVYACGSMLAAFVFVVGKRSAVVAHSEDDGSLFHLPLDSRTYLAARLAVAARSDVVTVLAFSVSGALAATVNTRSPFAVAGTVATVAFAYLLALAVAFVVARLALAGLGRRRFGAAVETLTALLPLSPMLIVMLLPSEITGQGVWMDGSAGWHWAVPPWWFSAWIDLSHEPTMPALARALLGAASVAALSALLIAGLGRRTIERQIELAATPVGSTRRRSATVGPGALASLALRLRSPEMRAGWILARGAMRAPTVRARLLPGLLMTVALALAIMGAFGDHGTSYRNLAVMLLIVQPIGHSVFLAHTDYPEAAWIYEALPVRRPGDLYLGALLAGWVSTCLPGWALLSFALFVTDPAPLVAASIVFAIGLGTALSTFGGRSWRKRPPFSVRLRTSGAPAAGWTLILPIVLAFAGWIVWILAGSKGSLFAYALAAGAAALAFLSIVTLHAELEDLRPAWLDPVET